MKFKIDWESVFVGCVGLVLVWLASMGYATYTLGKVPHDWLQAFGVLVFFAGLLIAWHCLSLAARALYWSALSRKSRASPRPAPVDQWPQPRIDGSTN